MAKRIVRIDALPESAWRCSGYDAIVCVDVLLSATTIVTALAQGRRVFSAPAVGQAAWVHSRVKDPLVVTDALDSRDDAVRFGGPFWLATAAGKPGATLHISPLAEMLAAAARRARVFVACLRNLEATANEIALHHLRVVILGVGEAGEVASEDQMVAAWLAGRFQQRGFELEGRNTADEVERWGAFDPSLVGLTRSAERLRARGRGADVDFVLGHVDDVNLACAYADGELRDPAAARRRLQDDMPTPAWGITLPVPGR
jgi:phosphosulfolactate phosphohydrolase-like enzyme